MKRFFFIFLSFIAMTSSLSFARTGRQKMADALQKKFEIQKNVDEKVDAILVLNNQVQIKKLKLPEDRISKLRTVYKVLRDNSANSQKSVLNFLEKEKIQHQKFYIVNAIAVHGISKKQLTALSQFSEINKIIPNYEGQLKEPLAGAGAKIDLRINLNSDDAQSNIKAIEADRVWNELKVRGQGIVVAGQDSGYDWEHPSLKKSYRGYNPLLIQHDFNWHDAIRKNNSDCAGHSTVPCDDDGHGTHTMGTILGDDGHDNHTGIAPEAKWMGCRNMNKGNGTLESYLECFQFFLAPYPLNGNSFTDGKPEMAPHIINNSWACPATEGCKGEEFLQAIQNLQDAGIFVVVSAGNDGPECESITDPPAMYSGKVFVVGAYDVSGKEIAFFSSRGPSKWNQGIGPDIVAPGVNIRSSVPKGGLGDDGKYDYKSGTSMAGPHVAGVVALLWSANPELIGKVEKTWQLIRDTATPMTSTQTCGNFPGNQVPNSVSGHGLINAFKLVSQNMKK